MIRGYQTCHQTLNKIAPGLKTCIFLTRMAGLGKSNAEVSGVLRYSYCGVAEKAQKSFHTFYPLGPPPFATPFGGGISAEGFRTCWCLFVIVKRHLPYIKFSSKDNAVYIFSLCSWSCSAIYNTPSFERSVVFWPEILAELW